MWTDSSKFIVLEGLDGAGTTTQAALLHEHLEKLKTKSLLTREPTDSPIGRLIRDVLAGRKMRQQLSERELALLFAADRLEHSRSIESRRATGLHVISDRYLYSSLAYQTLDPSISADWVIEINGGFAVPDLTIYLSVPVDECLRRISLRKENPTIYENRDFLQTISDNYIRLASYYKAHAGPLAMIDGSKPVEDVHRAVLSALDAKFKGRNTR